MLQLVPVEVGQQVAPGEKLARVANPSRLKAELSGGSPATPALPSGQTTAASMLDDVVASIPSAAPAPSAPAAEPADG